MSYSAVWCNGQFVGGWPFGYASYSLDLTPYLKPGAENVIAIRLENTANSSRWYPGGGIYRNVWLTKTAPVHVAHWGTHVTTPEVTREVATVNLRVKVENRSTAVGNLRVGTQVFELSSDGRRASRAVATASPL
jgi:beta-galactosidase